MGKETEVVSKSEQSILVDLKLALIIKIGKNSSVFPQ